MNAIRHKGEFQQFTVKMDRVIELAPEYKSNLMVAWSMYIGLYISKEFDIVVYDAE